MRNKVTSSGEGDVQLRMNGVNAEIQDILVLRTEDVIRIEYDDDSPVCDMGMIRLL